MKKMTLSFVCLLMLTYCSVMASGQTKARGAKGNLNAVIKPYVAKTVRALNRNPYSYKYEMYERNIFHSDVDSDGDFDAVVEMFFCGGGNCHPTTKSSKLVVFLNDNGNYRFAADKDFRLYGKITSVEDEVIYVDIYSIGEDEPQCCPSLKRSEAYSFRGNQLIKLRN